MIISYLARLILLLPEITSTQANKLTEIVKAQKQFNFLNLNQIQDNIKISESTKKQNEKKNLKKYLIQQTNQKKYNFKPAIPCLLINETMRKKLIQVKM